MVEKDKLFGDDDCEALRNASQTEVRGDDSAMDPAAMEPMIQMIVDANANWVPSHQRWKKFFTFWEGA